MLSSGLYKVGKKRDLVPLNVVDEIVGDDALADVQFLLDFHDMIWVHPFAALPNA